MHNPKSLVVLENPTLTRAASSAKQALSQHKTLLIIGNCHVKYSGRASSKLGTGERIVIIKEDGSVLVHRPTDYSPVNWQPPGCLFKTEVVGDKLQIRAIRRRPMETILISFDRVYLLTVLSLVDEGAFSLYASEEDMQKAILIKPDLVEAGLKIISYEKKIEPGFVDVYGTDDKGRLVVIEIKRGTAGKTSVLQLAKYIKSIKDDLNRKIRGILVAPGIAKGVQPLLTTLNLEFKPLSPRKCAKFLSREETGRIVEYLNSS